MPAEQHITPPERSPSYYLGAAMANRMLGVLAVGVGGSEAVALLHANNHLAAAASALIGVSFWGICWENANEAVERYRFVRAGSLHDRRG